MKVLEREFYDKVIFDKEKIREASRSPYNISPHLRAMRIMQQKF
jgi:hypothetical protein